jgi:hypothetical protein
VEEAYGKWWRRLQFTLIFLAVTIVAHGVLGWFHGWLQASDPYKEPEGRAFKVFQSGMGNDPDVSPGDRLRLFYWYGE